MIHDLKSSLRAALVLLIAFTLLLGLAYPLAITGIAQTAMPDQANGSLIRDGDTVRGSALIGQTFTDARYFHGRPSAAGDNGYDASASSGSNFGPTSKDLIDRAKGDAAAYAGQAIPVDAITASGSGLDPDISPAFAKLQVARVASARGMEPVQVQALVDRVTRYPLLGILGEPRVNVLLLNRQLDAQVAQGSL